MFGLNRKQQALALLIVAGLFVLLWSVQIAGAAVDANYFRLAIGVVGLSMTLCCLNILVKIYTGRMP